MPLSRLSPRRYTNKLAIPRVHTRTESDRQRHEHLLAAIEKTRAELAQWQTLIDHIDALFGQYIAPRERTLTKAVSDVTEKLITHFSNDQLDIPDKSLLGLWILENLTCLKDHPFSDATTIQKLNAHWLDLLDSDGPVETQLAKLTAEHNVNTPLKSVNNQQSAAYHDSEYTDESSDSRRHNGSADTATSSSFNEHPKSSKQQYRAEPRNDYSSDFATAVEDVDTNESPDSKLIVDKLFRQLAKVLHPDREQDEEEKARKNDLMGISLKARQENDIDTLLALHCEHVGELPDELDKNSYHDLIRALEAKLQKLQQAFRHQRFADPLHTLIVERYSSSNKKESERLINNHASSLDEEIVATSSLSTQLFHHDGLLDALDDRRAIEQDRMSINDLTGY